MDYHELATLCLMYLDENYTTNFHAPGAVHHARYMSKKHILCQVSAIDQRSKETSKPKQGASTRGSQIGNFHSSDLGSGFFDSRKSRQCCSTGIYFS